MRILQVHPFLRGEGVNPEAGGKSRVSRLLTEFLLRHGDQVALFPFGEGILGDEIPAPVAEGLVAQAFPTLAFPDRRSFLSLLRMALVLRRTMRRRLGTQETIFTLAALRNALTEFQPEVVHSHFAQSDLALFLRAWKVRVPIVLTHHTGEMGFHLELYDHIIFLSQWMREHFAPEGSSIREKSSVLYYPVGEDFRRGEIVSNEERQAVAFVGRPTRAKGLDVLIEAWRREPGLRRIPIRVCGSSADEATFSRLAGENGVQVRFEGRLSPPELQNVLSHSILLVNPSRLEGFSVAILEALCCGTPVIGWAPQIAEIQSRWGFDIGIPFDAARQTSEDLARSALELMESPLRSSPRSKAMAECARRDFSMERYGQDTRAIYGKLAGLHEAGPPFL